MTIYAHTGPSGSIEDGQTLQDHLESVANRCAAFAGALGYAHWGYVLGLLHDAGKASNDFQRRLAGSSVRVDHATSGARLCIKRYGDDDALHEIVSTLMSLAIVGHHGGMPNVTISENRTSLRDRLEKDLACPEDKYLDMLKNCDLCLPDWDDLEPLPVIRQGRILPPELTSKGRAAMESYYSFSLQLLGRLLYSCLVDADYMDTERFVSPEVAVLRNREYDSLEVLLEKLKNHMDGLKSTTPNTPVNVARARILEDCLDAANWEPGLFTLSVPTGGGKTLSSVYSALKHAVLYGMQRVIYAIPFTSVAQQTAEVFRSVFGKHNVLEHHSAHALMQLDDSNEGESSEAVKAERLATQNWDAPIIVTTNVQLLESLYANSPSKCRKLHNVAGSVIVLDEAQTLPDSLLKPTLAMLEDLCIDFSTSVVLCTATQPALDELWPFGSRPREIAVHTESFAEAFSRRVKFTPLKQMRYTELAEELSTKEQVLCVVGTKKKARNLYLEVVQAAKESGQIDYGDTANESGFFHLSTNMVATHRMGTIEEIRRRLSTGKRCVVVSTQLIEAGVDVDFPEAYRELAGIDSLMQVAGRCNREGRWRDNEGNLCPGMVHIFELVEDNESQGSGLVPSWLGAMKSIAKNLIQNNNGEMSEMLIRPFFSERYGACPDLDQGGILEGISKTLRSRCKTLEYERYANVYKIIEDNTSAVYVPWDQEAQRLLDLARKLAVTGESSALFMPLQQYSVGVYPHFLSQLKRNGDIEEIGDFSVLVQDACMTRYSQETGLLPTDESELNNLVI